MKRITILLSLALLCSSGLFAQVFNTSSTLKTGQFSLGVEPALYINGGNDFNLFLHAGAGIVSNIDFGLKLGGIRPEPVLLRFGRCPCLR